jgi:hypothetical protein
MIIINSQIGGLFPIELMRMVRPVNIFSTIMQGGEIEALALGRASDTQDAVRSIVTKQGPAGVSAVAALLGVLVVCVHVIDIGGVQTEFERFYVLVALARAATVPLNLVEAWSEG